MCKAGGTISFLLPHPEFNSVNVKILIDKMQLKGFSAVTLKTWQRASKKIPVKNIEDLLLSKNLSKPVTNLLLQGLVYSVTVKKIT